MNHGALMLRLSTVLVLTLLVLRDQHQVQRRSRIRWSVNSLHQRRLLLSLSVRVRHYVSNLYHSTSPPFK